MLQARSTPCRSMAQRPPSGYCRPLSVLKMGNVYRMGRVLYETIWAWVRSVSILTPPHLICFHFSPQKCDGWSPSEESWDQGSSAKSAGSQLHSLPHGVHLPAVSSVEKKNECQVELQSIFMLKYSAYDILKCSLGIACHARKTLVLWILVEQVENKPLSVFL